MRGAGDGGALSRRAPHRDPRPWALHAGWIAALAAVLAVLGLGALTPGFDQLRHPVALLGSAQAAYPSLFGLGAFLLPGLAVAVLAAALEWRLGAEALGRAGRIGTGLLLVSGIAFALQGVFALDLDALDGDASRRHVAARAASLLAFVAATLALAPALWRRAHWRGCAGLGLGLAALVVVDGLGSLSALVPGWQDRPGLAERVVLGAWLAWPAALGLRGLQAPPAA